MKKWRRKKFEGITIFDLYKYAYAFYYNLTKSFLVIANLNFVTFI